MAAEPEKADVADVAERVHERALRWLRKHKYLDARAAEDRSNEPSAPTPIEGFASLALGGRHVSCGRGRHRARVAATSGCSTTTRRVAAIAGWS
jgi:hypothetical protein